MLLTNCICLIDKEIGWVKSCNVSDLWSSYTILISKQQAQKNDTKSLENLSEQ